jgi:SAM-dependent methyltransferase
LNLALTFDKNGHNIFDLFKRMLRQFIKQLLFFGTKFQCPLCGYRCRDWQYSGGESPAIAKWQIVGAGKRKNICVRCGSNDRERLVYAFLQEKITPSEWSTLNILHLAPELNLSHWIRAQDPKAYLLGDLHVEGYHYPESVKHMDVLELPFSAGQLDWVICNHVLEHIPDDLAAMSSIYRILKPGGEAILQVPYSTLLQETYEDARVTTPQDRALQFGQEDHVRIYGMDYLQRLKSIGFECRAISISDQYPRWGLNPSEVVFYCKKQ